jgi:hypothetical protein
VLEVSAWPEMVAGVVGGMVLVVALLGLRRKDSKDTRDTKDAETPLRRP